MCVFLLFIFFSNKDLPAATNRIDALEKSMTERSQQCDRMHTEFTNFLDTYNAIVKGRKKTKDQKESFNNGSCSLLFFAFSAFVFFLFVCPNTRGALSYHNIFKMLIIFVLRDDNNLKKKKDTPIVSETALLERVA